MNDVLALGLSNGQISQPGSQISTPTATGTVQPPSTSPQTHGQNKTSSQALVAPTQKQNRLTPLEKPAGLDPILLLNERENR